MPYRTLPEESDYAIEARREIAHMGATARRRRLLASVGVGAVVTAAAALVVVAGATHRHPRPLACTKMHIVFENAPHVPPLSYDACQ